MSNKDEVEAETIENLNRLLAHERKTTAELEEQVRAYERDLTWTRHRVWDEAGLPVPRIELRWALDDDADEAAVALLVLVYRFYLGTIEAIPLGETRCHGSAYRRDRPSRGEPLFHDGDKLDLPRRDGVHMCHDAKHLKLRAFISTDHGDLTEIDPETREQTWLRHGSSKG